MKCIATTMTKTTKHLHMPVWHYINKLVFIIYAYMYKGVYILY